MSKATDKRIPPARCTREEAIRAIQQAAAELGRPPKKTEIPDDVRFSIKALFGKWVYALEEAGLRTPSEQVMRRRAKNQDHWKKMRAINRQRRKESKRK